MCVFCNIPVCECELVSHACIGPLNSKRSDEDINDDYDEDAGGCDVL